jgi:single-stranded-DNA-specific exonuclease
LPDCHESLAGIVAGRIRERYYKPTFVLTKAEKGLKGSGRSIEAYHMYEGLNQCKDLLSKFGGHKLAAGLSLEEGNLLELRKRLNEFSNLTEEDLIPKIAIDMQLPFSYITEEMIRQLSLLEPFGKGNTKPVFVEKDLEILNMRVLGKNQNVLRMQVRNQEGYVLDAMYFGDVQRFQQYYGENKGAKAAFTFYPEINVYQGRVNLQIVIQNYR